MGIDISNIPRYDFDKRHWKKIYGPEELNKLGELITGIPADEIMPSRSKPTVRVRKYTKPEYYFPTG